MVFWTKPFGTIHAWCVTAKVSVNPCRVVQQFECRIKTKSNKNTEQGKHILQTPVQCVTANVHATYEYTYKYSHVNRQSHSPPSSCGEGAASKSDSSIACYELNRLDCVFMFLSQISLRFASLDLFYPACLTYDVSKGNTSPAFLSIVEAKI